MDGLFVLVGSELASVVSSTLLSALFVAAKAITGALGVESKQKTEVIKAKGSHS